MARWDSLGQRNIPNYVKMGSGLISRLGGPGDDWFLNFPNDNLRDP
jgi:hypothetical protein